MKTQFQSKLLGVLLVLVMVLALVPVSALTVFSANKTEVEQIETYISAEHVPYAGKKYKDLYTRDNATIYGSAQNSGSDWVDDAGMTIDIKGNGDFNEWYNIRYQFEAGRTYTAEYTYMINPAYEKTHMFTESTTVTLTNPDPAKCTITGEVIDVRDSGRIVDVRYTMTIAGERNYPDIEAVTLQKIKTPADGVQAETTALMYSNCTLTSQSWSPNSGTFEAGNSYTLTVNLHAKDGYKFADDFAPVLGIEGYEKAADKVELLNSNKDAAVSFTYAVGNYIFLDTLNLKPTSSAVNFLPIMGEAASYFPDLFKPVDGAPYEKEFLSSRQWYNEDDRNYMEPGDVFEAGKTYSYHSIFRIKTENEGTYRFASPTVQLENFVYQNDIQTEVSDDPLRISVTFYYTCKFPAGVGSSAGNPAYCYSYDEFKYAMENPDIRFVALGDVEDVITKVEGDGLIPAISVNGIKHLNVIGNATFTAPANDDGYKTICALLHTTQGDTLTVSGAGKLKFRAVANNSYNAVIYNQGGSVIIDSNGTLIGSYNTAVYGKAIWQEYGELRISGGQLFAENALAPGSLPQSHSAVYINGGQAWIQGGTFKTESHIDTIDLHYGLDIGQYATVDLSGGTFYGILLPQSSTPLANYMDEETYTPLSNESKFNPASEYSQGYVESGKVVRIAWLIDHVDVHINAPIAGVDISENYFNIPTSGCKVAMYYPQWYKNGQPVTYGTFEAGASYKVVVWVDVKADYGAEFTNGVTVAINNQSVAVDRKSKHLIAVEYDFGVCPNIVPEVDLTVTAPKEGQKPSYTVGCGSDAYYAVGGSSNYTEYRKWYMSSDGYDWWEINSNHTFMSDYYYKLVVDIRTNNGYEFPLYDNGSSIVPGVNAYVNDYEANVIKAYDQDPSRYITVEYNFGECNDDVVEKITITNIDAPVAGQTPDYTANCFGTGYSMAGSNSGNWKVNGIVWLRDGNIYTGSIMDKTEKFRPGHTYTVMIDLEADNGYTFLFKHSNSIYAAATINGNTAQVNVDNCSTTKYQVWYTFTCAQPEVNTIMLYHLDAPQAGKTPDTSVTSAYPELYEITNVEWFDEEGGKVSEFEQGRMYTVAITVAAKKYNSVDGCLFADTVKAYIDGTEVAGWYNTVTVNDDNTVTLRYSFRKPAEAPEIEIYAFTTQPKGGTLTAGESLAVSWATNFRPERFVTQYFDGTMWILWLEQYAEGNSSSYTFYNPESATSRFRVLAYIGDDLIATSNEFVITWKEEEPSEYTYYYYPGEGDGSPDFDFAVAGTEITLADCMFSAPAGKRFKAWVIGSLSGEQKQPGDTITITGETYIYAIWEELPSFMVSYNSNGGSGTMVGDMIIENGTFTLENCTYTAPEGQRFKAWAIGSTNGEQKQPGDTITITGETYIYAVWEDIPVTNYTITATAGANGTISPSGEVTVAEGEDKTFTITANSGYHIKDVKVNGSSVGAVATYTFNDVAANATITVEFEVDTVPHVCNPTLVPEDEPDCTTSGKSAYYHCECGKNYEDAQGNTEISNLETWGILNALDHEAKDTWSSDADNHWKECARCSGQQLEKAAHADTDNNGKCDTCEYQMSTTPDNPDNPNDTPDNPNNTPDNPNNTPDDPSDDKAGLGAGAIALIVIGSVVVIGIGGFALFWFVIKKKT